MRISPIILRLREAIDDFIIGGSIELDMAANATLQEDMMFVVPIAEDSPSNLVDPTISQELIERFAVVVAIDMDYSNMEKLGVRAYDRLHDIRSDICRAILGWKLYGAESVIYYRGGQQWGMNNAYLWYQYDFEIQSRFTQFDGFCDLQGSELALEGEFRELKQRSQLPDLNTLYNKYILWPSANLPWADDDMPDSSLCDMEQVIDLSVDPDAGAFGRGWGDGFDFYKILNRK